MPRDTLDPMTHEPVHELVVAAEIRTDPRADDWRPMPGVHPHAEPARLDANKTNTPPGGDTGAAEAHGAEAPKVVGSIPTCSTWPGGGSADAWKLTDDARECKWGDGTMVLFPFEGVQALVQSLLDRATSLQRELEAYKRAKAENDERFMLERDEARAQLAEAQRIAADAMVRATIVRDLLRSELGERAHPTCCDPVYIRRNEKGERLATTITLNEYHRANLLWLLCDVAGYDRPRAAVPGLDTGDWAGEIPNALRINERGEYEEPTHRPNAEGVPGPYVLASALKRTP